VTRNAIGPLALALCLAASGALAQPSQQDIQKRYTPAYGVCMSSPSGQSTSGMLDCIGAQTKVQDKALNVAYAKALRDLTPDERRRLQDAQRAWITFRDADCLARVDPLQWGTISRINGGLCVLDRTIERTIELQTFPPNDGG
jgi:uncharacterized protein YecT (DUF1311 family)